jgi:hypothetical protein
VASNNRSSDRGSRLWWANEGVDDLDKAPSVIVGANPRRSTSSLGAAEMSTPEAHETFVRIGCGALVGLFLGLAIVVGTVSYWANSISALVCVVALSVAVCALIGWRFGDRFFHSLHKWIGWLR